MHFATTITATVTALERPIGRVFVARETPFDVIGGIGVTDGARTAARSAARVSPPLGSDQVLRRVCRMWLDVVYTVYCIVYSIL